LYKNEKVAWLQCADPFGTRLAKPLQTFDINESIELCRGYFIDNTPSNMESCAIGKVLRQIVNDWYNNFMVIKRIAVVYQDLDANQKGIVYKAAGFKPYAKCGRARHYSVPSRGNRPGNKIIWAKALKAVSGMHYKTIIPNEFMTEEEIQNSISQCSSSRKIGFVCR
jgi:hypothetical protein